VDEGRRTLIISSSPTKSFLIEEPDLLLCLPHLLPPRFACAWKCLPSTLDCRRCWRSVASAPFSCPGLLDHLRLPGVVFPAQLNLSTVSLLEDLLSEGGGGGVGVVEAVGQAAMSSSWTGRASSSCCRCPHPPTWGGCSTPFL
jgi:hypothetical protein